MSHFDVIKLFFFFFFFFFLLADVFQTSKDVTVTTVWWDIMTFLIVGHVNVTPEEQKKIFVTRQMDAACARYVIVFKVISSIS